tara:strand:+ start:2260 stop:2427 length:168 start_codon:yes stop_codon:yes gene_type:complete
MTTYKKTQYKNIQNGTEFVFDRKIFIKVNYTTAQIKDYQKFLSIHPLAQVQIIAS